MSDELVQAARKFIETDVLFCNRLLNLKRHWVQFHSVSCVVFALLYAREPTQWNWQFYATVVSLVPLQFALALGLFLFSYWLPEKSHEWFGWLPVVILRWRLLEAPDQRTLSRFVAETIREYGSGVKQTWSLKKQRIGMIGWLCARRHALSILRDTVLHSQ